VRKRTNNSLAAARTAAPGAGRDAAVLGAAATGTTAIVAAVNAAVKPARDLRFRRNPCSSVVGCRPKALSLRRDGHGVSRSALLPAAELT
jgi:hypothetical protein